MRVAVPSVRRRRTGRVALGVVLCVAAALSLACSDVAGTPSAGSGAGDGAARSVVVLQGDGMAQAHRDLIRLTTVGPDGRLAMDRLPVTGSVDTSPADDEVTDSAAAATAFATGVRTTNGSVGVDEDGEAVPTVLELARDAGRATGLVTTSQVTDASPAAFAAHAGNREDHGDIARQYLDDTRVDVVLGGGAAHWSAGDDDLSGRAEDLGYTVVSDADGLAAASGDRILGLFAEEEMFEQSGEGEYAPAVPLADMTRAALEVLDRHDGGFFLLVEEEGIDEMAHHNNAGLVVTAGQALDAAVEVVLDYQARNPATLVVVVGDHETGGLDLTVTDPGDPAAGEDGPFPVAGSDRQVWADWSTGDHTDADTPITAGGPGAAAFAGDIDNTDVFAGLRDALRLPQ